MAGNWLGNPFEYHRSSDVSMTYSDYLQARELIDYHSFQITKPIKQLITQNEEAFEAQFQLLEKMGEEQVEVIYDVVYSVQALREATESGFEKVGSILEWGFGRVAFLLGRTNDLLTDIKYLVENPSRTWAYEQFNRGRDLFRRGHYQDALESVERAIDGYGNELGEKTEYRFHFFRGIIKLGDFSNNSPQIIDANEAEKSFLQASVYAAHDFPEEAANAQLYAAHAASIEGRLEDAVEHANKGLSYHETAGLRYEVARSLVQIGRPNEAKEHLKAAIRLDKELILKAAADHAFGIESNFVENTLREILDEVRALSEIVSFYIEKERDRIAEIFYKSPSTGQHFSASSSHSDTISIADHLLSQLQMARSSGGVLDIRSWIEKTPDLWVFFEEFNSSYKLYLQRELNEFLNKYTNAISSELISKPPPDYLPTLMGVVGGFLAFYFLVIEGKWMTIFPHQSYGYSGAPLSLVIIMVVGFLSSGLGSLILTSGHAQAARKRESKKSRTAGMSKAIGAELKEIQSLNFYGVSKDVFDLVPRWVFGKRESHVSARSSDESRFSDN